MDHVPDHPGHETEMPEVSGVLGTNSAPIGWPCFTRFSKDIAAMTEIFTVDEKLEPRHFWVRRDRGGLEWIVEGVVGQQAAVAA